MSLPKIDVSSPKRKLKERRGALTTLELPEISPKFQRLTTPKKPFDSSKIDQVENQIDSLNDLITELTEDKKSLSKDLLKAKRQKDDKKIKQIEKIKGKKDSQIKKEKKRIVRREVEIQKLKKQELKMREKQRKEITKKVFAEGAKRITKRK